MAFIDTLKLAHALRDKAGFSQEAAEGASEALNDALTGSAATKADISELRVELGALKWVIGIVGTAILAIQLAELAILWHLLSKVG
jgi:hypothetical protein